MIIEIDIDENTLEVIFDKLTSCGKIFNMNRNELIEDFNESNFYSLVDYFKYKIENERT